MRVIFRIPIFCIIKKYKYLRKHLMIQTKQTQFFVIFNSLSCNKEIFVGIVRLHIKLYVKSNLKSSMFNNQGVVETEEKLLTCYTFLCKKIHSHVFV